MPKEKIIAAIDVGSSKICTIVASISNSRISVIGNSTIESRGIDRGVVNDIDKAVEAIAPHFPSLIVYLYYENINLAIATHFINLKKL
jgi:cell division ATPase FtsA